jgi:hypothetical protein
MRMHRSLVWMGSLALLILAFSLVGGLASPAQAAASTSRLHYYGADLRTMTLATGVDFEQPQKVDPNGPWPQRTDNYCFVAVVQAMVNYADLKAGLPMRYPRQSDQGPASGDPADEVPGQILYDMDHQMIPPDGPLPTIGTGQNRRPYTLANIAYDFGGDPRAQAFGTTYETLRGLRYHEHIYHNGPEAATMGMARALARYSEPVIALVNHAKHSVLVAGVWATGNPAIERDFKIESLAVYNPWDQQLGPYLSQSYYVRVSYEDWLTATHLPGNPAFVHSWFALPYQSNGNLDPDPSIGIYQAGPGTSHPDAHHWIGNYVVIQRDDHPLSADFTFDEHDRLMLAP